MDTKFLLEILGRLEYLVVLSEGCEIMLYKITMMCSR